MWVRWILTIWMPADLCLVEDTNWEVEVDMEGELDADVESEIEVAIKGELEDTDEELVAGNDMKLCRVVVVGKVLT